MLGNESVFFSLRSLLYMNTTFYLNTSTFNISLQQYPKKNPFFLSVVQIFLDM